MLKVTVEDLGIGVKETARSTIFESFHCSEEGYTSTSTGIGLFTVNKRIESLGGKCGVSSRSDDFQGASFWFMIPYIISNTNHNNVSNNICLGHSNRLSNIISTIPNNTNHININQDTITPTPPIDSIIVEINRTRDIENNINDTNNILSFTSHTDDDSIDINNNNSKHSKSNITINNNIINNNDNINNMYINDDSIGMKVYTNNCNNNSAICTNDYSNSNHTIMDMDMNIRTMCNPHTNANVITGSSGKSDYNNLHILVVDDSLTIRRVSGLQLELEGHIVSKATNGSEALEIMKCNYITRDINLVLMDIQMPVMNGIEATILYRKFEALQDRINNKHNTRKRLLIIGTSANSDLITKTDSMNSGI